MNAPPLSLYIHWPFCKAKCPYCDFNSHVREKVDQERWQKALLAELDYMAGQVGARHEIISIFFGGGTPSLMPPDTVSALIDQAKTHWQFANDVEITLEANPTSAEAEKFRAFKQAGVNRLSLGVQSLRQEDLQFLGRQHSVAEALKAVEMAAGIFDRYTFDLIYARPGQTVVAWEEELTEALRYADGHLSLYQLTMEPDTPFERFYRAGDFSLPDEEAAAALYEKTAELCAEKGLTAYEVSNYAKPGQESRHNVAGWRGVPYIGVGPGAHGRLPLPQWTATATQKSPERWLELVEKQGHGLEVWEPLSPRQRAEELLLNGLRLKEGIEKERFLGHIGQPLAAYLHRDAAQALQAQGFIADTATHLAVTEKGRLLLDAVIKQLVQP